MKLRKILTFGVVIVLAASLLAGCSGEGDEKAVVIKVGASPSPHAEILEIAKGILAKQGYELEIVTFEDYVIPNTSLESGELDANYFQHITYMNDVNKENGTNLVSIASVHYEPFGIYGGKSKDLKNLKDGATIAVPNDPTNEARALQLLQQEGIIEIDPAAGIKATIKDITSNPKNIKISELEAATLPRYLQDVDFGVINGNYAIAAGLDINKDAVAIEAADSIGAEKYANVLCVKAGDEERPELVALKNALLSDEVKAYMEETYGKAVVPLF